MPIDAFAAAASGFGDLAGGINDIVSSRLARKDARNQFWYNAWSNQNAVSQRVADAERAGVHPSLALGVSPNSMSTPFANAGGSAGDGIRSIGSGISKIANAKANADYARKKQKAELRLLNAQADNVERLARGDRTNDGSANAYVNDPQIPEPVPGQYVGKDQSGKRETFEHDQNYSDAEEAERRYGDIMQEVAGLRNLLADAKKNNVGASTVTQFKKDYNNLVKRLKLFKQTILNRKRNWEY
jgi:hypothetical protein